MTYVYIRIIVVLLFIILLMAANRRNVESFQSDFKQTLWKWEKPFNCNSTGYYNAEPRGIPPLNPIYSYPTFNFHSTEGPKHFVI